MQQLKDKVSIRQLVMIYIITGFSPALRFLPAYTSKVAKEAGWLSPFAALIPIGLLLFFLNQLFSKTKYKNTFDLIHSILGKYFGSFVLVLHLLWTLFLLAYYTRLSAERLVSSVYPNVNIAFFIIITLIVVSYLLRSGATAIARMGELLTPILLLLFVFLSVFLIPKIRVDALLPVYFDDTLPILQASIGTLSLFSYAMIILMLGNSIVGRENMMTVMIKGAVVFFAMLLLILIMTIGILGYALTARSAIPFLIIVKQISVLDTIENIESIVVAMWIFSDAMMILTMAVVSLNLMKYLFRLSDSRNLINILMVFMFVLSLGIASTRVELDKFASTIVIYLNTWMGFGVPALLYAVGKIRHKI